MVTYLECSRLYSLDSSPNILIEEIELLSLIHVNIRHYFLYRPPPPPPPPNHVTILIIRLHLTL